MVDYNKIFEGLPKGNKMSNRADAKAQVQQKMLIGSSTKSSLLQRTCACGQHTLAGGECEECHKKREGTLQRAGVSATPAHTVPPIVHEVLSSSGQPLDAGTRALMEPRFGHDFSSVRVHTDEKAAESARAVNSLAYTFGRDVVFGAGHYVPASTTGRKLLAHELTHVVQQRNSSVQYIRGISQPGDKYEQEAEKMAHAIVSQDKQEAPKTAGGPQAQRQSGGESESGDYNEQEMVGGEFPTQVSEPGIIQQQGDGGTDAGVAVAPATLTYSTVTPRTSVGCGGFKYAVKWGLSGANASTNGFIVQKIRVNLNRELCAGASFPGRNDFSKTYWEAWQVQGGNIFVGTSTSPHSADTFQVPATPDQKGVNLLEGNAKYIDGYTAPLSWGSVPEAQSLPSTETPPAGWSDSGSLHRSVRCAFDCCNRSDAGALSGDG